MLYPHTGFLWDTRVGNGARRPQVIDFPGADVTGSANGISTPRLLSYQGEWGAGEEYAYEALNFADGTRTAQQIAADLTAEYGAIPSELVVEYLQALKKIGVVQ